MKAKPIMIQGTMSNAGKSLTAAALCRVLKQEGLRVGSFQVAEHGAQFLSSRKKDSRWAARRSCRRKRRAKKRTCA